MGTSSGTRRRHSSTSTRSHAVTPGSPRAGALVVDTGVHTGRSPKDKFVVREPGSESRIWWSDVNAETAPV